METRNKMTSLEFRNKISELFPKASEDELRDIVWMGSAFPMTSSEHTLKQLGELSKRAEGDINKAFEIADKEIEEAMKGRDDG